ncbi:hypothetical protein [Catenuloplanes indicus]|uniref:Uncharacterized protein n=1 Tax=Catenuloplanes indicus TaxID=137267 RepID=A0AAE3VVB3_9ACTN|nr:hypothetical protein [Catenuloplanes indicus]MDQ0363862.1 hypothetical protein [Catenuloplanes indicus]
MNTAVVVGTFTGGAIGSAAAGGWTAITTTAIGLTVAARAVWAVARRRLAPVDR